MTEPIRDGLTWERRWVGPDRGLIWNWERGRQMRDTSPELAARARAGELMELGWQGGTHDLEPEKNGLKFGSLRYLAQWQGLRGEDLEIELRNDTIITCTVRKREVTFRPG
jgi:hypothetical protein